MQFSINKTICGLIIVHYMNLLVFINYYCTVDISIETIPSFSIDIKTNHELNLIERKEGSWERIADSTTMAVRKITRNSARQAGRDETGSAYSFPRWVSHLNSPTDLTKSLQLLPRPSVLFVSCGIKARDTRDARISRNFLPRKRNFLVLHPARGWGWASPFAHCNSIFRLRYILSSRAIVNYAAINAIISLLDNVVN